MTQPSTITQRFLSKPNHLGVVAVGFNGGQVRFSATFPWQRTIIPAVCDVLVPKLT